LSRGLLPVFLAVAIALPGVILEILALTAGVHVDPAVASILFGLTIIGGAFLLSWAAEVMQLDVSAGLALALLALIAILPEYVVGATFAWDAPGNPDNAELAIANMTGANRLLIGLFWPIIIGIVWYRQRHRVIQLNRENGLEIIALLAATLYAFIIPFKGSLTWIDLVILGAIFAVYVSQLSRLPAGEPHLVGPAQIIGSLPAARRRLVVGILGVTSAAFILLVGHAFGESLVETGQEFGISEFLLVQWLAPIASEAPELVVVTLFSWRGATTAALGALVSSKINQWTLLVAMLPLIFAISAGGLEPMVFPNPDNHFFSFAGEEIFLTAAQSLFAVVLLLDLRLGVQGAALLVVLFVVQVAIPGIHLEIAILYLVLSAIGIVLSRHHIVPLFTGVRDFLREADAAKKRPVGDEPLIGPADRH
jgi:cation:H+ antiporter